MIRIADKRLFSLVWLACLFSPSFASAAQSPKLERSHTVELIGPNQPGFEAALDASFPGLRQLTGFEAIKAFVVVLRNNASRGVKAYVVKWDAVGASTQHHERTLVSWVRGGREAPSGETIILKPDETRLVSPLFNWAATRSSSEDRSTLLYALAKSPLGTEAANAIRINVWLDAAVFEDGLFAGPDKGNFHDRYETERNGQRDEAASILQLLRRNLSDDEIGAQLNSDLEKGQAADGNEVASLLEASRGREARTLFYVLKRDGRVVLEKISLRLSSYEKTALRTQ